LSASSHHSDRNVIAKTTPKAAAPAISQAIAPSKNCPGYGLDQLSLHSELINETQGLSVRFAIPNFSIIISR